MSYDKLNEKIMDMQDEIIKAVQRGGVLYTRVMCIKCNDVIHTHICEFL